MLVTVILLTLKTQYHDRYLFQSPSPLVPLSPRPKIATRFTLLTTYLFPDRTEYRLVTGAVMDVAALLKFLQVTYQELYPHQQNYQHLQLTVDRYLSSETPLWFVTTASSTKIACLWLGIAIDQINGIRHPNVLLVYVDPAYRRQGIGKALMQHAEAWAKNRGHTQMGLQVFTANRSAIELYQQLGYQPRSISMMREL